MKRFLTMMIAVSLGGVVAESCQESGARSFNPSVEKGMVSGKATDAKGSPLKNVRIELNHTVWSDKKLSAQTDENGYYSVTLPAEPRGNWTIEAIHSTEAYGQQYQFVLDASDNSSFGGARGAIRNFTWKLLGEHIGGQYGGEVEVDGTGTGIPLDEVKLIFSPTEEFLVDGSEAKTVEKTLENVNGRYRAGFVPVGKYDIQAVYKGKILKLSADRQIKNPAESIEVTFQKNEPLAEAAYKATLFITQ